MYECLIDTIKRYINLEPQAVETIQSLFKEKLLKKGEYLLPEGQVVFSFMATHPRPVYNYFGYSLSLRRLTSIPKTVEHGA